MHCDIGVFWHFSEETREGVITKEGRSRVHLQPFQTLKQRFSDTVGRGEERLTTHLARLDWIAQGRGRQGTSVLFRSSLIIWIFFYIAYIRLTVIP